MNLSQVEDYAVRALVDMAVHPGERIEDIARRTVIPKANLAKVVHSLVRAGLVETTRGRRGGVRLARAPGEINLREVVEAVQGPLRFLRCPRRGKGCPLDPDCKVYRQWRNLEDMLVTQLETVRIADLLDNCSLTRIEDGAAE
jgi:Rrf2 family transcriptional regulator, nitric oxide-sensitive transcriptional repressor